MTTVQIENEPNLARDVNSKAIHVTPNSEYHRIKAKAQREKALLRRIDTLEEVVRTLTHRITALEGQK